MEKRKISEIERLGEWFSRQDEIVCPVCYLNYSHCCIVLEDGGWECDNYYCFTSGKTLDELKKLLDGGFVYAHWQEIEEAINKKIASVSSLCVKERLTEARCIIEQEMVLVRNLARIKENDSTT